MYRIKFEIYNEETEETVMRADTYIADKHDNSSEWHISEESAELDFYKLLRNFRGWLQSSEEV